MEIRFVTDYVCPYCYVAKKALEKAAENLGIADEITLDVQPFELTPEPRERVDTYSDPVRRAHYQVLDEPCRQLGINMKLPPKVIPRPYTRLAFEGRLFAQDCGKESQWNEEMYSAYFIHEQDIGDIDVLAGICTSLGMDEAAFREAISSGKYAARQRELCRQSREELQIHSVPTIYIDDEEITLADYTLGEMEQILTTKKAAGEGGFFCGIDGCGKN